MNLGNDTTDEGRGRHGRSRRGLKVRVLAGGAVAAAALASVGTFALADTSGDEKPSAAVPRAEKAQKRPALSKTARYQKQLLTLVNAERTKAGCRPLRLDRRVQAAAQAHAKDMAARDYYEHTSPEGKSAGDRMRKAGYRAGAWGENIHKGPKGPKTAMRDWMRSSGHRANILNCAYKDFGAGVSLKANGPWWVQNFATRL
ncbi:CAP domain-containing protein [Streptomyces spectabilis]|uniref:CAP domain-containing protein n=1 Tax=Streptomyces spectabilis TaxID=68270 RepID=A0A516R1V8_STRST|nr:CAP domain-containing protein [Streptomyces spectabilis]QDQ09648.1 CAP domain-containing protein [Streptomyces spectabilis]